MVDIEKREVTTSRSKITILSNTAIFVNTIKLILHHISMTVKHFNKTIRDRKLGLPL